MEDGKAGAFGGTAGQIVRGSMSIGTGVTGMVIGLVIFVASFVLGFVGAKALAMLFGQIVIAVALARFALNGMSGESRGTIFSTAGGAWPMALAVAGRYLALNAAWMVPVILMGWGSMAAALKPAAGESPGALVGSAGSAAGGALMVPVLAVLTS